jgi:hypothetical protein
MLTFPIAAALAVISLLRDPLWAASRGLLVFATVLTWIGMIAYFRVVIVARIKDRAAGEAGGPIIYMGWSNRFNVVTYLVWIIIVAGTALSL